MYCKTLAASTRLSTSDIKGNDSIKVEIHKPVRTNDGPTVSTPTSSATRLPPQAGVGTRHIALNCFSMLRISMKAVTAKLTKPKTVKFSALPANSLSFACICAELLGTKF